MLKKIIAVVIAAVMAAGMTGCTSEKSSSASSPREASSPASADKEESKDESREKEENTHKVYNILCWNDDFLRILENYYPGYEKGTEDKDEDGTLTEAEGKIGDVTVRWKFVPEEDGAYENALDEALLEQVEDEDEEEDEKIDLFLTDSDNVKKYTSEDAGVAMDVRKEIGLGDADLSEQYSCMQDAASDEQGTLRAVSWEATPGFFAYRRSIAKAVFGTDDPDKIQQAVCDWTAFDKAAQAAADKGYKMLSGYDDAFPAFFGSVSAPWTDEEDVLKVDDSLKSWVEQTKKYTDSGYNNKTRAGSQEWVADHGTGASVFGFFVTSYAADCGMTADALAGSTAADSTESGSSGDWAVCRGPASFAGDGVFICGAEGSDNKDITKDIMKTLTCDADTMKKITEDTRIFTNSRTAMEELASEHTVRSSFFGGQDYLGIFCEAALAVNVKNKGFFDDGLNGAFKNAFYAYFDGTEDKDTAMNHFYKAAIDMYPDLSA